jgi:hypothetical protein
MAIREEIIVEAKSLGFEEATSKVNNLKKASDEAVTSQGGLASSMKGSTNAVLENGGAMGLLNDATGGVAMQIKDAVEASVLLTKSSKVQAIQTKALAIGQAAYTAVVGTSTGAMKIFRLALASTGIGLIVIAIGLLIANFDKVKQVLFNLFPGLKLLGKIFEEIINYVTDFVGATSAATRSLDEMVAKSEKSLKKNQDFLATDADKFDQYTRQKIQAVNDYNNAVKDANDDETKTTEEKLAFIKKLNERAQRDISKADEARAEEKAKKEKERQDKLNDIAKKAQEKANEIAKKAQDEAEARAKARAEKEKARLEAIEAIEKDYEGKRQDRLAQSELEKIDLEESRKIAELARLNATLEEKEKIHQYYDTLRKDNQNKLDEELQFLNQSKIDAQRELALDQKEWEIENELDPILKIQKQNEFLEEQYSLDLERAQREIDDKNATLQQKADAEANYNRIVQDYEQATADKAKQIAEEKKRRDEIIADSAVQTSENAFKLIGEFAGEGSEIVKGVAVSQATISGIQGVQSAYTTAVANPITTFFPAYPFIQAGIAGAFSALQIKKILSTPKTSSSVPTTGSSSPAPAPAPAPNFNLVQGTGANQIAESIGSKNKPIQAYVVSGNVTSSQALDRNIVENSSL